MGVDTEADRRRQEAEESVKAAILSLGKIVINQCDGYEDYSELYTLGLRQSLLDLMVIRDRF